MDNQRQFAEGHNATVGNVPAQPGFAAPNTVPHDTIPRNEPHVASGRMPANAGNGIPLNAHDTVPAAQGHTMADARQAAPGGAVDVAPVHHENAAAHPNSSISGGAKVGEKIKGIASMGHGIGETLRGNINAAVDTAVGSTSGQEKNERIARQGHEQFAKGNAQSERASGRPYGNH